MKRHFDEFDVCELSAIVMDWNEAKQMQASCVSALMDRFGIDDADMAVDLLNSHQTHEQIMQSHGVEVHCHHACALPWYMDKQTGFVILFALGGALLAVFGAKS